MPEKENNWVVDNWSALQSVATLIMMAVAGLVWGLKLESRIDLVASLHHGDMEKMQNKITALESSTQKGILPVTEVRINALQAEIDGLHRNIDDCLNRRK